MTTPTIFAVGSEKVELAPELRNGGSQVVIRTATVPSGTATSTVIGLIPFNKGARLNYGGTQLLVDDIGDGSLTLDFGYVYTDDSTYTNDPDAFISASTAGQAGGIDVPDATAGFAFVAEADGYFAITTGGSATDAEGDITIDAVISYDA